MPRVAEALQGQVAVGVGDLDDVADLQLVQDGGHLAVGSSSRRCGAGSSRWAAGCTGVPGADRRVRSGTETYWPPLDSVMGGVIGGLEGQHDDVLAGLLAVHNLEGCVVIVGLKRTGPSPA